MFNTHRPVLAIKRYLEGEKLKQIRRELAISKLSWSKWWQAFQETAPLDNENK